MRTAEGKEKAKVKAYLKSIGAYSIWPVPCGYGEQGVDCYACIDGKFWAIETKAEGKEATKRQLMTLAAVTKAKGNATRGTAAIIIDRIKRHHGFRILV